MSLADTHTAIVAALDAVQGLRIPDAGPTTGTPPDRGVAVLEPDLITFDQTYGRGSDLFAFNLRVFVPTSAPRTQLSTLEELVTDVKAAVEDTSLVVAVTEASDFGGYSVDGVQMYGCRMAIEVTGIA